MDDCDLLFSDRVEGWVVYLDTIWLNHCLVVVESAYLEAVIRENAGEMVLIGAQGEISDLPFTESTDESFILSVKVPLNQDWFFASRQ